VRRTTALVKIAVVLMDDPFGRHWGYKIGSEARVVGGTLYPLLRRMVDEGWMEDGWEPLDEAVGRPPRRHYELTDRGRQELGAILGAASSERRFGDVAGLLGWTP